MSSVVFASGLGHRGGERARDALAQRAVLCALLSGQHARGEHERQRREPDLAGPGLQHAASIVSPRTTRAVNSKRLGSPSIAAIQAFSRGSATAHGSPVADPAPFGSRLGALADHGDALRVGHAHARVRVTCGSIGRV